jgi:hypothetical protein
MAGADRAEIVDWMDRLRAAIFDAVTENDVREIVRGLVEKAKKGDRAAVQTLFTYCIGTDRMLPRAAPPPSPQEEPPAEERERIERATLKLRESRRRAAGG